MLRVTVYLKSGSMVEFEAESIKESDDPHPKFRLSFPVAESGGRRLVYLDRDDVSAVVVHESGSDGPGVAAREALADAPVVLPDTLLQEVQEVLAVTTAGATDLPVPAPSTAGSTAAPPASLPTG